MGLLIRARRWTRALPLWVQAPLLLVRFPALLIAVVAAVFLLAIAVTAGPLFLSAESTGALRQQIASVHSRWDVGLRIAAAGPTGGALQTSSGPSSAEELFNARASALQRATEGLPSGLGPAVVTILGTVGQASAPGHPNRTVPVLPLVRTGGLDHIRVVTRLGGPGVWLADTTARLLELRPGDSVVIRGANGVATVRVTGIYHDLAAGPLPEFWSSLGAYIVQQGDQPRPPPLLLADESTFTALESRLRDSGVFQWEYPYRGPLTISQASQLVSGLRQLGAELEDPTGIYSDVFSSPTVHTLLPDLVDQAVGAAAVAQGPVNTVSYAGEIAALMACGAVGAYWVRRRGVEYRQLGARGVGPFALGTRALLEAVLPAAAGAVIGWIAAFRLIHAIGPSTVVDQVLIASVRRRMAWATLVALALVAIVIGWSSRQGARVGPSRLRAVSTKIPWELAILALAGASYFEISTRGTAFIDTGSGPPRVDPLVLLFPLLFLAGGSGVAVRVLRLAISPLRTKGEHRSPALLLAFRRLTWASGIGLLLAAASALAIGILLYAGTLAASVRGAIDQKARAIVGSDVSVVVGGARPDVPKGFPYSATMIEAIPQGAAFSPGGTEVAIWGIDRRTFPLAAFWDSSFANEPLPTLLSKLASIGPPLPVVLVGPAFMLQPPILGIGVARIPVQIVEQIRDFPGIARGVPTLIADRVVLDEVLRSFRVSPADAPASFELWARGSERRILQALSGAHVSVLLETVATRVRGSPGFLAIDWTFGYMRAVGIATGLIAFLGLLLYVQAEERSRDVAYAIARMMGFSKGANGVALGVELGGLLAASLLIGAGLALGAAMLTLARFDPLPAFPPSTLLRYPLSLLGATAGAIIVASLLGVGWVIRHTDRVNVAEVMRLGS